MAFYISKTAKYYDGKTGNPREVALIMTGSSLILSQDDTTLETWGMDTITVIDHPAPPVPGIFGSNRNKEARLYVNDAAEWKELYDRLPKNAKKKFVLPNNWSSFIVYIVIAIISTFFLFLMFPKIVEQSAYLIPYEMEKTIGKQAANSLIKNKNECVAPEGRAALNKAFYKLKKQTSRKIKYKVFIVEDKTTLNAFAAPGGYLFIFSKIIDRAETPEEVIGVLAHEISHIDLYHTTKGLMRNLGMQFVLSLMVGGSSVESIANFFSQMSYSRDDETEADMHGRKIMIAAKIDPIGIRKFFEGLNSFEKEIYDKVTEKIHDKKQENSDPNLIDTILDWPFWEYFSTHPDTQKRIERLAELEEKTTFTPALTKQEWNALKNICDVTKPIKI